MPALGSDNRAEATASRLGGLHASDWRYLVVTVAGFGVDLGAALLAIRLLGLSLVAGAVVGFCCAVLANYLAHEFWTYRHAKRWSAKGRALGYVATALSTLAVRAGVILALGHMAGGLLGDLPTLVIAAGASLVFNFLATKLIVFRGATAAKD